jgi:colanic acid/amylovoran biosynthesis glycosyltransferase
LSYLGVKHIGANIYYASPEVTTSSLRIVTISSVTPVKNLECFIQSLAFIDDIEIEWTHIGSVDDKRYDFQINKLIHEVLDSKKNITVVFKGFCSAEMVFDFLKNTRVDLVLNCSHSEGLPVSLMEATAAALPIIAFNVGGISEIVKDNINGFLIQQKNDPVALSEKIKCFYALDYQAKQQFSINSYSIWEQNFDYQKNHEKYGQFLTSL